MRRRLYWVLPDLTSARRVVDDMLLDRIEERHLHFVARDGADMPGLHPANVFQRSDLVRAAESGLIVDVPRRRVQQIEALLHRKRPEANSEGMEPNIPAFP